MGEMLEGFDYGKIVNQIYRHYMEKTYQFNLMLVGTDAIGKSTLVKSLFQGQIEPKVSSRPGINEYDDILEENGVSVHVRCIETSRCESHSALDEYKRYINNQFESYFKSRKSGNSSWNIDDRRVHCCLYMIPPNNRLELKRDDLECMKALQDKVNLVPVIANSDKFSSEEVEIFKDNILRALELNKIQYYRFQHDEKLDEERAKVVKTLAERFPFAISAVKEATLDEGTQRYKWIRKTSRGVLDIRDDSQCDFEPLVKLLLRHCMLDLIVNTHEQHYAKFKREIQ